LGPPGGVGDEGRPEEEGALGEFTGEAGRGEDYIFHSLTGIFLRGERMESEKGRRGARVLRATWEGGRTILTVAELAATREQRVSASD
jgi:hypothetical protein